MLVIDDVAKLIRQSFGFLLSDFDFHEEAVTKQRDYFEVRYSNETTGVIIAFELRETYVFVKVCRLVSGSFIETRGELRPDAVLNCFDLNDPVEVRDPTRVVQGYFPGQPEPEGGLQGIIERQADNLRTYGQDVLRGDFSVFADLDSKVKARAREFAIRKWGKRAKEFGWEVD